MQAASLLLTPDRSIGEISSSSLSDQALMETLVEKLPATVQACFKDTSGSFKEVCKWEGVKCNGRRRVTTIEWKNSFPEVSEDSRAFSFDSLPAALSKFSVHTNPDAQNFRFQGRIETSRLPRTLKYVYATYQSLEGTVDLRRLPPNIELLTLRNNSFFGSAILTCLPSKLDWLSLSSNNFTGRVHLHSLPKGLYVLELNKNQCSGSVNLACLPDALGELQLGDNALCGSIFLCNLPRKMTHLFLENNHFSGRIEIMAPPPSIDFVDLQGNNFDMDAQIDPDVLDVVCLDEGIEIFDEEVVIDSPRSEKRKRRLEARRKKRKSRR